MKGNLQNFQDTAHKRHRRLLVFLLLIIITFCFTIAPLQTNALNISDNGLENQYPMTIIPEFNNLVIESEPDYLYKYADLNEFSREYHTQIDFYDNFIFRAARDNGLLIYNVGNPQELELIAKATEYTCTTNTDGFNGYFDVCYSGGYVYA